MPKIIKKKAVKKKTDQEEGVKSVALQTIEALKKKQQQLVIGVSVIIAVFALFFIFSIYSSSQYKKAYSIEMEAGQYYYGEIEDASLSQEDMWKKALELYQQSVDTKATPTAMYYLGNCYFNLGDYENAIKQYNNFTDKFGGDKAILPLVYQKLASAYFRTEQNDNALDTIKKLGKVNRGIFKDTALVLEARHLESAGAAEKALEIYREIIMEFPASPWTAEANSNIAAAEAEKTAAEKGEEEAAPEKAEAKEVPAEVQQSEAPKSE
jgi:tetratricopeptide (TPR) repeat protein